MKKHSPERKMGRKRYAVETRPVKTNIRTALILTAVFVVVGAVGMARHEMWRDEVQPWLLGKDAHSLGDVIHLARYQKHPALWYMTLHFLSRISRNPEIMQAFHLGLAALSVFLLFAFAPFKTLQKIFLGFGYYLLFEYGLISRNYALGILALFLFCVLYPRFKHKPYLPAVCLFILANTSLFGVLLAGCLGAVLLVDVLSSTKLRRRMVFYAVFLFIGLGLGLSFLQLKPMPDALFDQLYPIRLEINSGRFMDVLVLLPRAYLVLPPPVLDFWNHSLLEALPWTPIPELILGGTLIVLALLLVRKSRAGLVFYILSTASLLGWSYVAMIGVTRHFGHLFLAFLAAVWLARVSEKRDAETVHEKRSFFLPAGLNTALTLVFLVQFLAGVFAYAMDIRFGFSQAKAAAGIIKEKGYARHPIVGHINVAAIPVAGYLGRGLYYLRGDQFATYLYGRVSYLSHAAVRPTDVLDRAERYCLAKKKDCVIVLNYPLLEGYENYEGLAKIGQTPPAIVSNERYYLYLLKYRGPR